MDAVADGAASALNDFHIHKFGHDFYSPTGQFAVERANLLGASRAWLDHLFSEMAASREFPWADSKRLGLVLQVVIRQVWDTP